MKTHILITFFVAYLFLLYGLYATPVEDGFIDFFSCTEINCSSTLTSLVTNHDHRCAFYDLKEPELITALDTAVIFDENYDATLHASFDSVSSKGLMHHKFCILDEQVIFTGSWNPTFRGTNYNDNYVLLLSSPQLVTAYSKMLRHLENRRFSFEPTHTKINGQKISAYTCPLHDCQEQVRKTLTRAQTSVSILAFTFTDHLLAQELVRLHHKGISIEVIFEGSRITRYSVYDFLLEHNVSVFKDGNPYTMHEKLFIIDEDIIIAGSYNPTKGATQKNDENLIIIESTHIAQKALLEYSRVKLAIYK